MVFLFSRTGLVVQETIDHIEISLRYGKLRVMPDE